MEENKEVSGIAREEVFQLAVRRRVIWEKIQADDGRTCVYYTQSQTTAARDEVELC